MAKRRKTIKVPSTVSARDKYRYCATHLNITFERLARLSLLHHVAERKGDDAVVSFFSFYGLICGYTDRDDLSPYVDAAIAEILESR